MEEPPRVGKQLMMLLHCLLELGLSDTEALSIVSRVAVDSMPAVRALVLDAVVTAQEPISTAAIAKRVGTDWKVVNWALEDLADIGLVQHVDENHTPKFGNPEGAARANPWVLLHEDADLIRRVFGRRLHPVVPEAGG
jgi:hypothetical protein